MASHRNLAKKIFSLLNNQTKFIRYLFITLCIVVIFRLGKSHFELLSSRRLEIEQRRKSPRVKLQSETMEGCYGHVKGRNYSEDKEIDNKMQRRVYQEAVTGTDYQEAPLRHYKGYFQKVSENTVRSSPKKFLSIERRDVQNATTTLHPLSKSEPYCSRIMDIKEKCAKYQSSIYSHLVDADRFIFDDKHKVVMCVVPKNACTTWKKMIWYMTGHTTPSRAFLTQNKYALHEVLREKYMTRLSSEEILKRLNTYTKFMVTRHPLHRLVSAYRDKIETQGNITLYRTKFGRIILQQALQQYLPDIQTVYKRGSKEQIVSYIKNHPGFAKLSKEDKGNVIDIVSIGYEDFVTFYDFVRLFILQGRPAGSWNLHWRPQYMLCNPCAIDYDYVIRFENLVGDSRRLLAYLQSDHPPDKRISIPEKNSTVDADYAKEKFVALPADYTSRLKKLYDLDFVLFNHDIEMV